MRSGLARYITTGNRCWLKIAAALPQHDAKGFTWSCRQADTPYRTEIILRTYA
jgi:hypothetical protein